MFDSANSKYSLRQKLTVEDRSALNELLAGQIQSVAKVEQLGEYRLAGSELLSKSIWTAYWRASSRWTAWFSSTEANFELLG